MEEAEQLETLNDMGFIAMMLFKRVKAIDELATPTRHEKWPEAEFAAEADRLELWAVNMGLFVSGHESLDYRVRQAESIKYTLQSSLTVSTAHWLK